MLDSTSGPIRAAIAFVTHTRSYSATDVLTALARSGFTTTERPHDRDTVQLISSLGPDVVVVAADPSTNGDLQLISDIAGANPGALIVLTPGTNPTALSSALAAGADLCIRESDGTEVITAQLSAIFRRIRPAAVEADGDSVLVVRDLALDFDRCQAAREGRVLPLTPTEFKILAYLAKNAGRVISPVEILRSVQEYTYTEREAQEIVKVYIRRIRRKVESNPSDPSYVVNVRGFGYMLERRPGPEHVAA